MAGAKRAPSSFVQLTTTIGCFVLMLRSFIERMTSRPASTPSTPSYLPPSAGCRDASRHRWEARRNRCGRVMNMLPILSTPMVWPAASHQGLEELAAITIRIRQRLAIVAAGDAGADFRHVQRLSHRRSALTRMFWPGAAMEILLSFSVSARHFCVVFASLFRRVFFSCFFTKSALRL